MTKIPFRWLEGGRPIPAALHHLCARLFDRPGTMMVADGVPVSLEANGKNIM
jgi:hypothetical protein